jgi:hypothetical protein
LLGWSLVQLNEFLADQKGLLQRATHIVTNFVLKGCSSRNCNKGTKTCPCQSSTLVGCQSHMIPRPHWLPGLDTNKTVKMQLQKAYKEAEKRYHRLRSKNYDELSASSAAIEFYGKQVNELDGNNDGTKI